MKHQLRLCSSDRPISAKHFMSTRLLSTGQFTYDLSCYKYIEDYSDLTCDMLMTFQTQVIK